MERSEIKPYIAKRVAKELHDGDVVNLGIGLPTMVPDYLHLLNLHYSPRTDSSVLQLLIRKIRTLITS